MVANLSETFSESSGDDTQDRSGEKFSLGVLDLVPRLNGASAEHALQQAVLLAQQAEAWGYKRYWTSEHHDMADLASASPEVLLSHIGAKTDTILLGSGAVLLPHYSPLKVAESFHLLASLYPGRIELGLGRAPGGGPHATMALSGNYLQHVSNLPAKLASLTELLEGRFAYEDVPVTARPIPEIPLSIWMLGTNVKSATYAAQFGMGYVFGKFMSDSDGVEAVRRYREEFVPSAGQKEPEVMVAFSAMCAANENDALNWSSFNKEDKEVKRHVAGTPEQVWQYIRQAGQRLDTNQILMVTAGPDYERRLESYRLLAGLR